MSKPIITVEKLTKRYRIGMKEEIHDSIADAIMSLIKSPFRSFSKLKSLTSFKDEDSEDILWALKDVSFEVNKGEVLGIVGKNGAGKSTLLKLLSRITSPTEGSIDIKGRVASLLEVGTGFHPELTGRENVFLNGAVLGMRKKEVEEKFDEIVAFAGVKRFIDTPVKRYSSGMRVRLAFAVAAHLEPEILIIDEVLSVGDYEFQKKCLGKMHDVAGQGRTVLFVSHNLAAVKSLCTRALLLQKGEIIDDDTPDRIVDKYLKNTIGEIQTSNIAETKERNGSGLVRINDFYLRDENNNKIESAETGEYCKFVFKYKSQKQEKLSHFHLGFGIRNENDTRLTRMDMHDQGIIYKDIPPTGEVSCVIKKLPLERGKYIIGIVIYVDGIITDIVDHAAILNVKAGQYYKSGVVNDKGPIFIDHYWKAGQG